MSMYEPIEYEKYKNIRQIRSRMPVLPLDKRLNNLAEVELGFSEELAVREAWRCLICNAEICTGCRYCALICPNHTLEIKTVFHKDHSREVVQFDIKNERCIFCGLCTVNCPTKTLVMDSGYELSVERKSDLRFDLRKLLTLKKKY
ncbi:MAG: 4Fe-4S dicluster domain-containing protein [Planctomycetota bacterium]|nr:4Fe-4S dicluster domain-containing protein [Planctomycetota bacterium]